MKSMLSRPQLVGPKVVKDMSSPPEDMLKKQSAGSEASLRDQLGFRNSP